MSSEIDIRAGDVIEFTYGIPPVKVRADVIERGGTLIGLCPGHIPPEFEVFKLHLIVREYTVYPKGFIDSIAAAFGLLECEAQEEPTGIQRLMDADE